MEENRALGLKYWRKPEGLALPSHTRRLWELVVFGQFLKVM